MTQPTITSELVSHVNAVVHRLQGGYLPPPGRVSTGASVADLARLRRADPADPASGVEVWPITLAEAPDRLLSDFAPPSGAERAMHAAICLYAVHQQSVPTPMHQERLSLGRAVSDLVRSEGSSIAEADGVRLRFQRIALAPEWSQRVQHLRGLITLLRGARVPLDYGQLARDLFRLQQPASAGDVRMRWGRDLYRSRDSVGDRAPDPVTRSRSGLSGSINPSTVVPTA